MQSREPTNKLLKLCYYPSKNEQQRKEKLGEVKNLLEAKADPNANIDCYYNNKRSLLTQAISYRESEIALALIEAKADPNKACSIDFYPLERAIIGDNNGYNSSSKGRSQLDVALSLIEAKANPDATWSSGNQPINKILLWIHWQEHEGRN